MQRSPAALADTQFDIAVIGGGAFGAAAARDAALRGLRTVLIERGDFGSGASAECFKMVHGGIRYLQHADVKRVRSSCHERSALLRIAPHLVSPLPIVIPTYGYGRHGKMFLGAGAQAYDWLTFDRNSGIRDRSRHIDGARFLSKNAVLGLFPHLNAERLTGAVVFEDGQMHNPARLVLAFVKSAVAAGATACNYIEAMNFLWQGSRVRGVSVRDRLSGDVFDVRARLTLNAAGPWADYLEQDRERFGEWRRRPFSRDAYFIVDRVPTSMYGLAVQGLSRDKDALLSRATRHLFAVPWRDKTLLGVWHKLFPETPDDARVRTDEIDSWITELNTVYPALNLAPSEVTFAHCGLVPFGETATATDLSFGKESRLIDHRGTSGVHGLVSVVGIRFTTARADAARAVDLLLQQSPMRPVPPATDRLALPGGNIDDFEAFALQAQQARAVNVSARSLHGLLRNHGSEYWQLIRLIQQRDEGAKLVPDSTTLLAEIWHAVDNEMAMRLEDVVMRRTDIAAGHHPGRAALDVAAAEMSRRLAWSPRRTNEEIAATGQVLSKHLARPAAAVSATVQPADAGAMLAETLRENAGMKIPA